jgi:hypothetical protein
MYTLGRIKIAKNEKELIDSLFSKGATASGYISEKKRNGVVIKLVGGDEVFLRVDGLLVTTSMTDRGRRYMFGLCSISEQLIFGDTSYNEMDRQAKVLANEIFNL